MNVLPVNFKILRILGLWYEEPQQLRPLKLFHKSLVCVIILNFTFLQLATLVLMRNAGLEVLTACLFMSLSYVSVSYKLVRFIIDRSALVSILDKLRLEICLPQNSEELAIVRRYQAQSYRLYLVRMITTFMSGFTFLLQSVIVGKKELPFRAYEMFDISEDNFAIAYTFQFITVVISISVDVVLDCTACAFMIHIGCQLDLLCNRLVTTGERKCNYYVLHHNIILLVAKEVQAIFIHTILPAFFCGLVTICSSIFQLAQSKDTLADVFGFCLYVGILLNQLYYFCWCGNELQFKNEHLINAIFRSDWTSLSSYERKNYWFMMLVGQKDLVLSYHGQCALNMVTYIWFIKTAYGAYNLLQQFSDGDS